MASYTIVVGHTGYGQNRGHFDTLGSQRAQLESLQREGKAVRFLGPASDSFYSRRREVWVIAGSYVNPLKKGQTSHLMVEVKADSLRAGTVEKGNIGGWPCAYVFVPPS